MFICTYLHTFLCSRIHSSLSNIQNVLLSMFSQVSYGSKRRHVESAADCKNDCKRHDAEARDRPKSKHHPLLTRKDPFFNARRFRNIVATSALGRAMDLQPISCFPVLGVFIDARVRVFLLHGLMCFFRLFFALASVTTQTVHLW